jgi:hypothetical protein
MSFATIVAGVFAVAKAVPIVANYIDIFIEKYIDIQIDKAQKVIYTKQQKRAAIIKAISQAKTDEDRKKLSVVLADIYK